SWTDTDEATGGQAIDLDQQRDSIGSLLRDPTVNIAPTVEQFGGEYVRPPIIDQVWDADPNTVWNTTPYLCAAFAASYLTCTDDFGTLGTANIVLGSLYQIDRVRLLSGGHNPERTVRGVRVFLGRQAPDNDLSIPPPFSPWAAEVRDNRQQVLDIHMPPNDDVGFLQVAIQEHTQSWEIQDIEIYARSFAKRSVYTSSILDLGRPMAWGDIRWSGSRGEQAKVVIQTRSGHDADPVRHWTYTGRGEEKSEVSASAYDRLAPGEKAGTSYDHGNWSFWSTYDFGDSLGTQVVSPSSRRYLQLQVEFQAQDDDGGILRALELRASEPLATDLVGEIWPTEARVGESTHFTYAFVPTIAAGDAGFDRLEISSSALLGAVRAVQIDEAAATYTVEEQHPHRIVIGIPMMQSGDSGALVTVDFDAQVLRYGDRFDGHVANSLQPLEVPQRVNAGDASSDFDGDQLSVATAAGAGERLLRVSVTPAVTTPNGDGINDMMHVEYELYEIIGQAELRVEIYDLAGRLTRQLHKSVESIGIRAQSWDGRDDGGRLVPPGVYVLRVSGQTDGIAAEQVRVLRVAY
ncbi:MAG: hypothetical protein HOH74_26005, partial [Gemmatimonadetes bacterium]|nr:hypothetical protein [Gemmatimonadota bacterium]